MKQNKSPISQNVKWFPILLLSILLLTIISGCGKDNAYSSTGPTAPGSPGPNEVWMQNNTFNPATKTVAAGTTITWLNKDGYTHTVTSNTPGLFSSGNIAGGGSFTHTFSTAGSFAYHCTLHSGMTGTVTAQ
jgi:plastocyanin